MVEAEDRAALAALFKAAYRGLFHYALAASQNEQTARDLIQEAFYAAAKDWPKLRGQELPQQMAWLRRVCLNKQVDLYRRELRASRLPGAVFAHGSPEPDPADVTLQRAALEKCWQVVTGLPAMQKRVAFLHWWEDMPLERVARLFDIKPSTARAHLHKARKAVLSAVGDDVPFALTERPAVAKAEEPEQRRKGA